MAAVMLPVDQPLPCSSDPIELTHPPAGLNTIVNATDLAGQNYGSPHPPALQRRCHSNSLRGRSQTGEKAERALRRRRYGASFFDGMLRRYERADAEPGS